MDTPVQEGHGQVTDLGARYFYPYLTLILCSIFAGSIHLDGEAATGDASGGGSGGTIAIDTPILEGHGQITANGGKGTGLGGGGAGGRILLELNTYVFIIWAVCMFMYIEL